MTKRVFDRLQAEICSASYNALYDWFHTPGQKPDVAATKEFEIPVSASLAGGARDMDGRQRLRVHARLIHRAESERCNGYVAELTSPVLRRRKTLLVNFQGTNDDMGVDSSAEANDLSYVDYPDGKDLPWDRPEWPFDPQFPPRFPEPEMFEPEPPVKPDNPKTGKPYVPDLPVTPPPAPSPPDLPDSPFPMATDGVDIHHYIPQPDDFPPLPIPLVLRGFFQYGWKSERKGFLDCLRREHSDDCLLLITGFSRGGAFATYLFADCVWPDAAIERAVGAAPPDFAEAAVYTFGAPATGELIFHYGFKGFRDSKDGRYRSFRIFNSEDRVPPPSDVGYPVYLKARADSGAGGATGNEVLGPGHSADLYEALTRTLPADWNYEDAGLGVGQVVGDELLSGQQALPAGVRWHPASFAVSNHGLGFYCDLGSPTLMVTRVFDDDSDPSFYEPKPVVQARDDGVSALYPWLATAAFDVDGEKLYWVRSGRNKDEAPLAQEIHVLDLSNVHWESLPLTPEAAERLLSVIPFPENVNDTLAPVVFTVCNDTVYWCADDKAPLYGAQITDGEDGPVLGDKFEVGFRADGNEPVSPHVIDSFAVTADAEGKSWFYFSLSEGILYRSKMESDDGAPVLHTDAHHVIVESGRDWREFSLAAGSARPTSGITLFWSTWTPPERLTLHELMPSLQRAAEASDHRYDDRAAAAD